MFTPQDRYRTDVIRQKLRAKSSFVARVLLILGLTVLNFRLSFLFCATEEE